jgi:Na+/H+ antiporter NhaA
VIPPLERLVTVPHPFERVFIRALFALANAGVLLRVPRLYNPIVVAIAVGLTAGKPHGVVGPRWIAVHLRLARHPAELTPALITPARAHAVLGSPWRCSLQTLPSAHSCVDRPALASWLHPSLAGSSSWFV